MSVTLANLCLHSVVAVLELAGDEADWADATDAGIGGSLPLIGGLVRIAKDKRAKCCNAQLKALEKSLQQFMDKERVEDREAVLADLEQFAPALIKATWIKPADLGEWNGKATDSIAQRASGIALERLPAACEEVIADSQETRPKFLAIGDPRNLAITLIIERLFGYLFAPPSAFDAALRQELQAVGIVLQEVAGEVVALRQENREAHEKTHDGIEEILAHLKGGAQVSEEALNVVRDALPKVVDHLERSNQPEAQDAEEALKRGDTKQAYELLVEQSEDMASAADDAEDFATKKRVEAAEKLRLAGALAYLNDTHEALAAYRRAMQLDPDNADGWNRLGLLLRRVGELDEAIASYKRVLAISEGSNDKIWITTAYGNLGIVYRIRGDLDKAEALYKKSLALNEELGRKEGMANQFGNLGIVYLTRGDLDESEAMYKKSLALNQELGRKEGMANQYGNLANVYLTRGDLNEAEAMFKKSLGLNEELGSKEGMATDYGNLGIVYQTRGDLDQAARLWTQSLALFREIGAKLGVEWVEGLFRDAGLDVPEG